ncbi:MAG TPA: response regulator [Burkholderiaceae bacterium]|jgi:FixJ family two-component response regulator|nr:response regulator [Burkholderiaceae bacterium]
MEPNLTVAVVDDELPIRKALTRLLRSASYQVQSFGSGAEFLASLEVSKPACLVLDIRMQGMTGFDVQARLQARQIALPIVFITALDDPHDIARAKQSGAIALLRKPFGDDEFLAAIEAAAQS